MNAHARPQTQEALPREAAQDEFFARPLVVTTEQYHYMASVGAFARVGRTELRRGVIVGKMNAVHLPPARVQAELFVAFRAALAQMEEPLESLVDVSIRYDGGFYPIGDIVVFDEAVVQDELGAVPGAAVRLVVEVAHFSRTDDLGAKRDEYAEAGLAEYWVADVRNGLIQRCAEPLDGRYTREESTPFGEPARSLTLPLSVDTRSLKRD